MKRFISSFAVAVLISTNAMAASLFQKTYKVTDNFDPEDRIVQTMKLALEDKTPNEIQRVVKAIDADIEGIGQRQDVNLSNFFLLSSGKGGMSSLSNAYLVGIPVSMNGTGLIERYETFFRVSYQADLEKLEETVTVLRQLDIE